MMKRVIFTGLALMVSMAAFAQEGKPQDNTKVILPIEVQSCNLPSAPPSIPEVPIKEDLLKAQKNVKQFQADMVVYRACLYQEADGYETDLTWGNEQAINNANDYSVDMEERVALMFNDALRAYKASIANQ